MIQTPQDRTFTVKAPRVIKPVPNGAYQGVIVDVQYRDSQYKGEVITYADLTIQIDGFPADHTVPASFPAKEITPTNSFGKFIMNWQPIIVDQNMSPRSVLMNKRVAFMVKNEPGAKDPTQMYPGVIRESLMPAVVQGANVPPKQ